LKSELWDAADTLRSDSGLRSYEYSTPILGILFHRFSSECFTGGKYSIEEKDKFNNLKNELNNYSEESIGDEFTGKELGLKLNLIMGSIEDLNPQLKDTLYKNYDNLEYHVLKGIIEQFSNIFEKYAKFFGEVPVSVFSETYEYLLGKFARSEGQRGGEFHTPDVLIEVLLEVLRPDNSVRKIGDYFVGAGRMFSKTTSWMKENEYDVSQLEFYGQDKVKECIALSAMTLSLNEASYNTKSFETIAGNTFYEDKIEHGKPFDLYLSNPPFNVDKVVKRFEKDEKLLKNEKRLFYGQLPSTDKANFIAIQYFIDSIHPKHGRAGVVLPNCVNDSAAGKKIRKLMLEDDLMLAVITMPGKLFANASLSSSFWFLDRGKKSNPKVKGKTLLINATEYYVRKDKKFNDLTSTQKVTLGNIVALFEGKELNLKEADYDAELTELGFKKKNGEFVYHDIRGLCKAVTLEQVLELEVKHDEPDVLINPGLHVGIELKPLPEQEYNERHKEYKNEFDNAWDSLSNSVERLKKKWK